MKNRTSQITKGMAVSIIIACLIVAPLLILQGLIVDSYATDVTYTVLNNQTKRLADMGDSTFAEVTAQRTQFMSVIGAGGLAVDTYYILIDLSDTTNYPHTETTSLIITACDIEIVGSGQAWRVAMGPVTAITANTTTVKFFKAITADVVTSASTAIFTFPASGVDTTNMAAEDTDITAVTTLTDLASPAGTTQAEVGDILIWVDELSGSNTATFGAGVTYWTK